MSTPGYRVADSVHDLVKRYPTVLCLYIYKFNVRNQTVSNFTILILISLTGHSPPAVIVGSDSQRFGNAKKQYT